MNNGYGMGMGNMPLTQYDPSMNSGALIPSGMGMNNPMMGGGMPGTQFAQQQQVCTRSPSSLAWCMVGQGSFNARNRHVVFGVLEGRQ